MAEKARVISDGWIVFGFRAEFYAGVMVYQKFRPYLNVLGMFTRGFVIGFPVVITFVENVGSVKGVFGISMQVSLVLYLQ